MRDRTRDERGVGGLRIRENGGGEGVAKATSICLTAYTMEIRFRSNETFFLSTLVVP